LIAVKQSTSRSPIRAAWRLARQFEESLRQQKIAPYQLENLCSLQREAGRERCCLDLGGLGSDLLRVAMVAATSRSIQRRTSGGADLTCSGENVKLIIGKHSHNDEHAISYDPAPSSLMQINRMSMLAAGV